jgi:predicted nucleic acid-binding protein
MMNARRRIWCPTFGTDELRIAATALSQNLILVTNNTKHFGRIPDLHLENTTTAPD